MSLDRTRAEERLGADFRSWREPSLARRAICRSRAVSSSRVSTVRFADARIAQAPVLSKGTVRNYRSAAMTVNSAN